jgi:hypothetical protein
MEEAPIRTSPWQVYFLVSSKEGDASLCVEHSLGRQTLVLPVHPDNAVPEALDLLEPVFAHYVAQWGKIMVPDPRETDARGFYLTAADVPDRIADPDNGPALAEIATRYLSPQMRTFFEGMLPVHALSELHLDTLMLSNTEDRNPA